MNKIRWIWILLHLLFNLSKIRDLCNYLELIDPPVDVGLCEGVLLVAPELLLLLDEVHNNTVRLNTANSLTHFHLTVFRSGAPL